MSPTNPEVAPMEQELNTLSKSGRTKAVIDNDPGFVPIGLPQKSRTQSFMVNVKRFNTVPARLMGKPAVVAPVEFDPDRSSLEEVLKDFCRTMTGEEVPTERIRISWIWFIEQYLQELITSAWQPIIVPVVEGLSHDSLPTSFASKLLVFRVFNQISQFMTGTADNRCTLHSVEQDLRRRKLISNSASRELTIQFIFQVLGWLAAFWDPALDASTTTLSLAQRNEGLTTQRRITMHSPAITSTTIGISEATHTLSLLLSRFGSVLPEPQIVVREAFRGGPEAGPEDLSATYLTFHSLQQDLKIEMKWTKTLNQHLEFDQPNNILYIFRYPSICKLMAQKGLGTLLSRTYSEWTKEQEKWTAEPGTIFSPEARRVRRGIKIEDYPVEVLLSYDILFGRCSKSRASAKTLLATTAEEWKAEGGYDPLLETLCTKGRDCPEVAELLNELQAGKLRDSISVDEYPFLGQRLATLHARSSRQAPRNLEASLERHEELACVDGALGGDRLWRWNTSATNSSAHLTGFPNLAKMR